MAVRRVSINSCASTLVALVCTEQSLRTMEVPVDGASRHLPVAAMATWGADASAAASGPEAHPASKPAAAPSNKPATTLKLFISPPFVNIEKLIIN
jgi:hypothetical protein